MQYGKCVFKCDNDLVNHQVVNMLFEDDITVSFTMNPFGRNGRYIHIMGTGGEIHTALAWDTPIKCYNYLTDEETVRNGQIFVLISLVLRGCRVKTAKKRPDSPKKGLPGRFAYCIIKLLKITQKAG